MPYERASTRYRHTGRRRLYLVLASLFLFAGLGMVAAAAYQFVYSPDGPSQVVWVRPGQSEAPAAVEGGSQAPPSGTEPFRLVIEKIGIDAPVSAFGLDENAVPRIPYDAHLVAWYDFSASPGTGDNAVFAAHVTWNGDAVFKRLGELVQGDRVRVQRDDGSQLVYEVTDSVFIEPSDPEARDWMLSAGEDVVTLITCGGERTDTDGPIGAEYSHRWIVRAQLIAAA